MPWQGMDIETNIPRGQGDPRQSQQSFQAQLYQTLKCTYKTQRWSYISKEGKKPHINNNKIIDGIQRRRVELFNCNVPPFVNIIDNGVNLKRGKKRKIFEPDPSERKAKEKSPSLTTLKIEEKSMRGRLLRLWSSEGVSLDKRYELIEQRITVGRMARKRGLVFWIRIKERFQLEAVSADSMVVWQRCWNASVVGVGLTRSTTMLSSLAASLWFKVTSLRWFFKYWLQKLKYLSSPGKFRKKKIVLILFYESQRMC